MIPYVVYLAATGEIVRTGASDAASLWLQPLAPGEVQMVVADPIDATTHWVVNGKVVVAPPLEVPSNG